MDTPRKKESGHTPHTPDEHIDEGLEETFPASDPPSYMPEEKETPEPGKR